MKIRKLIRKLKKLEKEHGNIPVRAAEDWELFDVHRINLETIDIRGKKSGHTAYIEIIKTV